MKNAEIIGDKIKINISNIFENFEFSPSLQLGFSKAIERVNNYGIKKIEQNIICKSKYFRKKLENFHQITFFENSDTLTGINTLKIKGINFSISSACSTSAHCIGSAWEQIRLGNQDVVIAGGAEDEHWTMSGLFDAMGALSSSYNENPENASRPFDEKRDG